MSTLAEQIAAVKRFISASVNHAAYYGPADLHPDTAAMRAVLATLEGLAAPGERLCPISGLPCHGVSCFRPGECAYGEADAPDPQQPTPSKEQSHREFYDAFHAWFMQSQCDFWNECDAPESLATIAVELSDRFAATAKARREALSDAEKWHWQRYTALRDSSPRSKDGLVSGMAGARMHEHRDAAEHFARAALTPQNMSEK